MARNRLRTRDRYPSGQVKPANDTPPGIIRRAVEMAIAGAADPRLASVLGRLRLTGKITDRQMAAGDEWAAAVAAYDRAMGVHRTPHSPSYERGIPTTGDQAIGPQEVRAIQLARARYQDGASVLTRAQLIAVMRVAVEDRDIPHETMPDLLAGLDRLAAYFRL